VCAPSNIEVLEYVHLFRAVLNCKNEYDRINGRLSTIVTYLIDAKVLNAFIVASISAS
jgi:hypothetical protein